MMHNRPDFNPNGPFKATRPFTMNGVNYEDGQIVDVTGVERRRLRMMYEAFMILPSDDYEVGAEQTFPISPPAPAQATEKPAKGARKGAATKGPEDGSKPASEAATPPAVGPEVKYKGFSNFYITSPDGENLAGPFKSKAEAEAELPKYAA